MISHTAERLHIASSDANEWLFERNPIDRRRVSASMIDHGQKAIVVHDETDLRMTLGIRGWADVLALVPTSDVDTIDDAGRTRVTIEQVRHEVEGAVLEAAEVRFPTYRVFDVADWREKH